jgi:glycosyltransferase involved in cell wall biosynthesis
MQATNAQSAPGASLRAVMYGGGIGIFPPLLQRMRQNFRIVATLQPQMPRRYRLWFLLRSFRWPRNAWYRKWRYLLEKTPLAFQALTRQSERMLQDLHGQYDLMFFSGAMFAPSASVDVPLFLFADFCRALSSRNPHDPISHFHSDTDKEQWLKSEGELYRSAARIFVGSEFVRRALIEHYGVAPERVIASGFGAGLGFGDPYDKIFDGRTILYIGKGDFEAKGGALLLDAFAQIRHEIPEAVLHIVGQDRLPAMRGVVNHGFVRERERIVALMRSAHVFVLPSLVDRNPISVLEAMAAATPCVVSEYAAIPELLGDGGIAVACGDRQALARAVVDVLRDRELAARLGAAGRRRYEERYDWDRVWETMHREIKAALRSG